MEKESMPAVEKQKEAAPHHTKEFKGYSIEELRYQRALVALRKDFCKSRMIHNVDKLRRHGLFGRGSSKIANVGGVASKIISGLGYVDYLMIGMSLFGTGKKIFRFFHKKK